ncbi:MAG: hypothetical protein WC812_04345 [Candidatus Pacearchaeota archaeon]|jgi:hypothetical protein
MKYQINQQKLEEGMEEHMKKEVNRFEELISMTLSMAKREISTFNYTPEEKRECIMEQKKQLNFYLKKFINANYETRPTIVPEEIVEKYIPEFRELAEEGKISLDNLLLKQTEEILR